MLPHPSSIPISIPQKEILLAVSSVRNLYFKLTMLIYTAISQVVLLYYLLR